MVHASLVIAIVTLFALVGISTLFLGTPPVGQVTYPHEPSCAWVHPFAPPCEFETFGCPEPQERYIAKTYNFRREAKICCCIPRW